MEDATHLPDNAFAVTGTSDDITHSDLERNQSNRLNMSTKELVDSGSIAIDFCCYFDPLDNCSKKPPKNPDIRFSFQPKCIKNLGTLKLVWHIRQWNIWHNITIVNYNYTIHTWRLQTYFRYVKPWGRQPKIFQLVRYKLKVREEPCFTLCFKHNCIFDNHGRIHIICCQVSDINFGVKAGILISNQSKLE